MTNGAFWGQSGVGAGFSRRTGSCSGVECLQEGGEVVFVPWFALALIEGRVGGISFSHGGQIVSGTRTKIGKIRA